MRCRLMQESSVAAAARMCRHRSALVLAVCTYYVTTNNYMRPEIYVRDWAHILTAVDGSRAGALLFDGVSLDLNVYVDARLPHPARHLLAVNCRDRLDLNGNDL